MAGQNGKNNLSGTAGNRETKKLVSIEKRSVQILALLLLVSLWFQSWSISWGLLSGGGIALLNFRWLWRTMEKVLFESRKYYGLQAGMRFLALLAALFVIIRYGKVHPLAFLVGLCTLVIGIFVEVIRESLRG